MHASLILRRTPMIRFVGRDRWSHHSSTPAPHPSAIASIISASPFLSSLSAAASSSSSSGSSSSSTSSSTSSSSAPPAPSKAARSWVGTGKAIDFEDDMLLPRRLILGGYRLEESEMEAIMSGGATNLA